jgi:ribonuclease P protein component
MLPKKERASSFIVNKVFQRGVRTQSPAIDLVYIKSDTSKPLFAVSVSKKAVKNSVELHKTRRRVYSAIPRSLMEDGRVCVFLVKKSIHEMSAMTLKECLKQLVLKVKNI